ncbi:transcriptional regulator, IclR family [Beutenbergia cavernae DSM 12333]|uniref:Glycerol operon regulatory protein n=1 Tax=Beutenbergia cavernae (strain ATCC BAA-8 / DSM 12333 / CCUG 43141 / JCM 11478 / NBRC 16432 / NCIMB 13614 / HKI 0122) TaxID=471853 RepID=C5C4W4_BEUC1|nr:IclR family transcriptional regulator [Beutenbergia cavernae]ACQ80092.1 transcriptional regulator, IclR family [Beutenbergia cavernae DSM 12333]
MGASSTVPAAAQTLAVLRYLAGQPAPVHAAALSRDVGLPRSTTYHLLSVLEREGFVVHLPEEQRYGLGVAALELGSAYARQEPLARLARPVLTRLVDAVGESAHLAVLHGREVLYVVEERARGRPPLVTDVGVRLPAHLTASGRALLAGLPRAQVRALFPDATAFVDRTGLGPGTPSALRDLLSRVRSAGVAREDGEVTAGFASVAAAVHDHTGRPVAGIAVTYPTELPGAPHPGPDGGDGDPGIRAEMLAPRVAAAAAELRRRIGGHVPPDRG